MIDAKLDVVMAWLAEWRPIQISRLATHEQESLVDGYRLALQKMTEAEVARARDFCEDATANYIPEPATFFRAGRRQDSAEQFNAAARAAGCVPAAWHRLAPRTFRAAIEMAAAGWNIMESAWSKGDSPVAFAWEEKYREACRLDDAGVLSSPPPPQAALSHRRDQAAADRGCAAAFAAIGLKPPSR